MIPRHARDKKIHVGINGFGRIGRIAARIILDRPNLKLVAINSRAEVSSHAYLLKYDSTYGTYPKDVKGRRDYLDVGDSRIAIFQSDNPKDVAWGKANVDVVIDASGKFRTSDELRAHLRNGVKFVVLSAPAKDSMKTIILGVNEEVFDPKKDSVISNSSCTTNCLATTLKVLHDNFTVRRGFMTTTHAVTDSQNLLDNSHKKEVRLRRAAFASLIPASTGSAKDIGKILPDLAGKIICQAVRVPLLTVSLLNLSVEVGQVVTREDVNKAFKQESQNKLKGILDVANEELVSKDFTGNTHSSIVDPFLTQVVSGNLVNVYTWYDNEWGYTQRLVDLVEYIGKKAHLP